uniref:transposase n=1 Tax=Myxococcus qinghaiensis TaxID=2906758 RepID=UPI0038993C6B
MPEAGPGISDAWAHVRCAVSERVTAPSSPRPTQCPERRPDMSGHVRSGRGPLQYTKEEAGTVSDMKEVKKPRRPRRSDPEEFKTGAVRLVLEEGKTTSQVARDLDLTLSALRTWVDLSRASPEGFGGGRLLGGIRQRRCLGLISAETCRGSGGRPRRRWFRERRR